jgi:hypothetical protein
MEEMEGIGARKGLAVFLRDFADYPDFSSIPAQT